MQLSCVWHMSLWFLIFSPFSHCITTDDQLQTLMAAESKLYSLHHIQSPLHQTWCSLCKALYWLTLGWPMCNFAQGFASVNGAVNINIWTTALCNSEPVSLAMPQGFPAVRKAITITLSKVSPHLFKLARLASVGVCGRYSSWVYIWCYVTWQWASALCAL